MNFSWRMLLAVVLVITVQSYANASTANDPVDERTIAIYHANYFLPWMLSSQPSRLAVSTTPDNQSLQAEQVSFQISFKLPIVENLWDLKNTLYAAYTQTSFWQAYNYSPFFRETNYQPELFISHLVDQPFIAGWKSQLINIGAMHQSNGRGGEDERSWNRLYVDAIFSRKNGLLSIEPWYIVPDASLHEHNADIARYLGHGEVLAAYKYSQQTFSISGYGLENGDQRVTGIFAWSFPLVNQFSGYVQVFSGYGQSLIEYNHHINSFGLGIVLGNWL